MYVVEITPQQCGPMFSEFGTPTTQEARLFQDPESVSLVVFTGGHDVSPSLYGEPIGAYTYASAQRDAHESKAFDQALKHKIPMVGICRGSQFLCVKSGGKLCQDLKGHGGNHTIATADGRLLVCNSTHHQMQLPGVDAVPLAWASPRLSVDRQNRPHYLNGWNTQIEVPEEYEVVYYPSINALGIQGHPEWLGDNHEFVKFSLEMARKYLFKKG